jgi:general stress protein 26
MAQMSLAELSEKMKQIDFAMFFTHAANGALAGRPMSNNGDVEYRGDSYFFSFEQAHTIADIERNAAVALSFAGKSGLLGSRPLFISVEGAAELIRDKREFAAHWTPDLDEWFENGIDTPGVVLIRVHASRIHYWEGREEGEIRL